MSLLNQVYTEIQKGKDKTDDTRLVKPKDTLTIKLEIHKQYKP
nr:hypothetical protein [Mycoplasmopsis bovis]